MASQVCVGLVGTSQYAELMYLSTLQSHPGVELVAVCGRNQARLQELAEKYKIPRMFKDYKEMIHQGNLDVVAVVVPDDLHYEITMQALDAGLHVICDKPLALTVQQAREMYEKAEKAGVKHMVMFTYRWMPFFRYVKDLLEEGYVGRCYHVEFRYLMGGGLKKEYSWRNDPQRSKGALANLGSHMIDMAHWLVGDITRVNAQLGFFVECPDENGGKIEPSNDSASLLVEFATGAQGMIHVDTVTHVADRYMIQQVILHGEAGSLEIEAQYKNFAEALEVIFHYASKEDKQYHELVVPLEYWGEVKRTDPFQVFFTHFAGPRAFMDALLSGDAVYPTFYDGYKAQQVVDAAYISHRSGKWEAIE